MDSWTYGGSSTDYLYCLAETPDGGHMMVGCTCSYGAGYSDVWLVRVDAHGNMIWNKTYGGPYTDYGCNIIPTTDGNYVIVGYTCATPATGMDESADGWLIKVDPNGNILWNKTYGTPTDSDYLMALIATSDGGYALAGATYPGTSTTEIGWLVKVDSDGNEQWSKKFGDSGSDCIWCLVENSDGTYTLDGQTKVNGSDDLWIFKVDSEGNELWSKTYGGSSTDLGWCLLKAPDGGYVMSGTTSSFGAGKSDFWFLKFDSNGELQWNQTYGGANEDIAYVVASTSDGGYAIVGSTMSFGAGGTDFWLIRTDSNGVMQWNQTLGGAGFDEGQYIAVTPNGVYAIAGVTMSFGQAEGECDGWLIETNAFDPATPTAAPAHLTVQQASMPAIVVLSLALVGMAAVFAGVVKKIKRVA